MEREKFHGPFILAAKLYNISGRNTELLHEAVLRNKIHKSCDQIYLKALQFSSTRCDAL
jgi:hypothetical protein